MEVLGVIGLIAGLGGIAMQTFGGVQAASTAEDVSEFEAKAIETSTEAEEAEERKQTQRILARQRAIGAGAGIDISSGSPLLIQLDSAREAELSALNVRRRGEVAAAASRYRGQLAARTKGGTILGGAAKAGSLLTQSFAPGSILGGWIK